MKKNIIENHSRYGDTITIEGMKSEAFIPLFDRYGDTMVLIGCLYLGSSEFKELNSYTLLECQKNK